MVESIDIVIYTNPQTLKHKQEDGFSRADMVCWWEFGRFPQKLRENYLTKLKDQWFKEYWKRHMGDPQPPAPAPLTLYDFVGKIYFAVKGFVVGSFDIEEIEEDENRIAFYSETWKELKTPIPCEPFRGFRYKWWNEKIS